MQTMMSNWRRSFRRRYAKSKERRRQGKDDLHDDESWREKVSRRSKAFYRQWRHRHKLTVPKYMGNGSKSIVSEQDCETRRSNDNLAMPDNTIQTESSERSTSGLFDPTLSIDPELGYPKPNQSSSSSSVARLPPIPPLMSTKPTGRGTWPITTRPNNETKNKVRFPGSADEKYTDLEATPMASRSEGNDAGSSSGPSNKTPDTRSVKHEETPHMQSVAQSMSKKLLRSQLQRLHARSRTSKDSGEFVKCWESKLLPRMAKTLKDVKGEVSITSGRGSKPGHRVIEILTEEPLTEDITSELESIKEESLSDDMGSRTVVECRTGKYELISSQTVNVNTSSTQDNSPDPAPLNARGHGRPYMGDSVGPPLDNCQDSATLGPMLTINGEGYWLLPWHLFDDKGRNRHWKGPTPPKDIRAVHPSQADRKFHNPGVGRIHDIGVPVAYSGEMHNSSIASGSLTRTRSQRRHEHSWRRDDLKVVTDWILFRSHTMEPVVNRVRQITPETAEGEKSFAFWEDDVVGTADPKLPCCCEDGRAAWVYSTGRSSGWTLGQIGETLCYFRLWNGKETLNWCVEPRDDDQGDEWNGYGMGIMGDSGAGVVDFETNRLVGQLWARNKYSGPPHERRRTLFTAISDIFDDIQVRFPGGGCERPVLPGPEEGDGSVGGSGDVVMLPRISEDLSEEVEAATGAAAVAAASLALPREHESIQQRSRAQGSKAIIATRCGRVSGLGHVRQWAFITHASTL